MASSDSDPCSSGTPPTDAVVADGMKKTLKDPDHLEALMKSLDDSRTQGKFCDIKIVIDNKTFTAHKSVLAASSQYFSGMFNSGWVENDASEIKIDGEANIFELLLDYMYKGQLSITEDTVVDILALSLYMQVMGAMKLCTRYLEFCYATESVLFVTAVSVLLQVQDNNQMSDLKESTVNYLAHNLMQFYADEREEFLENVTGDVLNDILMDKDVERNATEYQILECIIDWLSHDWETRKACSESLLKKVRLGVIPEEDLRSLTKGSVIQDSMTCRYQVTEVLHLQKTHREKLARLITTSSKMFATRNCVTGLIIVGGRDAAIRYFEEETSEWKTSPIPPVPVYPSNQLRNPASLVVDGILYVAGGGACLFNGEHEFKSTFHLYNPATLEWKKLPKMMVARERCQLVHMDGYIYALGGVNHSSYNFLNCVERFDLMGNKWESIATLPAKFCHISAVVYQGQLLIYGAPEYKASPGRVRHTLLTYHVSMNRWEVLMTGLHYLSIGWPRSVLLVENGVCYRIVYEAYMMKNPVPQVHQLQFHEKTQSSHSQKVLVSDPQLHHLQFQDKSSPSQKVMVCDNQKQNCIPKLNNKVGAFRINDDIFVNITLGNAASYCHKTGIKIESDQKVDVDIGMLTDICGLRHDSNWLKDQDIMSGSINQFAFHNL